MAFPVGVTEQGRAVTILTAISKLNDISSNQGPNFGLVHDAMKKLFLVEWEHDDGGDGMKLESAATAVGRERHLSIQQHSYQIS
jgi:hypothetical protein